MESDNIEFADSSAISYLFADFFGKVYRSSNIPFDSYPHAARSFDIFPAVSFFKDELFVSLMTLKAFSQHVFFNSVQPRITSVVVRRDHSYLHYL